MKTKEIRKCVMDVVIMMAAGFIANENKKDVGSDLWIGSRHYVLTASTDSNVYLTDEDGNVLIKIRTKEISGMHAMNIIETITRYIKMEYDD